MHRLNQVHLVIMNDNVLNLVQETNEEPKRQASFTQPPLQPQVFKAPKFKPEENAYGQIN